MKKVLLPILLCMATVLTVEAQRVGINTDNPRYTLDVAGNIGMAERLFYRNDQSNQTYLKFSDQSFNVTLSGTTTLSVLQNRIGIGNTNPQHMLDVAGRTNTQSFSVQTGGIGNDAVEHLVEADAATFRVGIGTSNPNYLLDVAGRTNTQSFSVQTGGIGNDAVEHLVEADAALYRVGIGTSSPTELLDVNGTTKTQSLQVGNLGTKMQRVVAGTQSISNIVMNSSPSEVTITFDQPFDSVPHIVATYIGDPSVSDLIGVISVKSISTTEVTFLVRKLNGPNGTNGGAINWTATQF